MNNIFDKILVDSINSGKGEHSGTSSGRQGHRRRLRQVGPTLGQIPQHGTCRSRQESLEK